MSRLRFWLSGVAIVGVMTIAFASACSTNNSVSPSGVAGGALDAKPGGASAYQLNLSHIECVEGGKVEVHFVLLHVPDGKVPGLLSWSNNGVPQPPVGNSGRTGNVWHFHILVDPGTFNVTSASVTVDGVVVTLHNPGAYAGEYLCTPNVCATELTIPEGWANGQLTCLSRPLGSESAECGLFGLAPDGKDAGNGGQSQTTSKSALLAIVKDGSVGCDGGAQAYTMYSPVSAGQTVFQPGFPNGGGISHITYCKCPVPANPLRR